MKLTEALREDKIREYEKQFIGLTPEKAASIENLNSFLWVLSIDGVDPCPKGGAPGTFLEKVQQFSSLTKSKDAETDYFLAIEIAGGKIVSAELSIT